METYAKVRVAVQEDLSPALPADVLGDLLELASRARLLDINSLQRDLVGEQTRRVLPAAQHKRRVRLLRIDNRLLDVLVDRRLDGAHEARAHVDTACAERQRSSETLAVGKAARGDEGHAERLAGAAQQDEVGDVCLADVASALEAIDGEEVDAELDGRLRVADRGALVQDRGAGGLQLLDDRPGAVAGCLDNVDLLLDNDAGVGGVVWGYHGGEKSEVDAEGVLGHGAAAADFFAQVFGRGLGEGCQLRRVSKAAAECLIMGNG
jgi:hypothetical protein